MKLWSFFFTALALIAWPSLARAAPSVNWSGPPCQWGAANFKVCSTEPSTIIPCFVSHRADYAPNPVEMALIQVCQRAKAALNAAADKRDDALVSVVDAELNLNDAVEDHPSAVEDNREALVSVAKDIKRLGEKMMVYGGDSSEEGWEDILDILNDLELNASVED